MALRALTPLLLPRAPLAPMDAATKGYVDDRISGVGLDYPLCKCPGQCLVPGDALGNAATTKTMGNGTVYYIPLRVSRAYAIATMGYYVTTAGLVSTGGDVGIYSSTRSAGNNDVAGSLLAITGVGVGAATTGLKTAPTTSAFTLQPGVLYWAAVAFFSNSGMPALRALALASIGPAMARDSATGARKVCLTGAAGTYGALPATAGTQSTLSGTTIPMLLLTES